MDDHDTLPASLAGMLPVGMISAGGTAAAAMAQVAQRKRGVPGWEAFHYERLASGEYEVTGGLAVNIGGVKKFQGVHDVIFVSEEEILAEMRAALEPVMARPAPPPGLLQTVATQTVSPLAATLLEQNLLAADIGSQRGAYHAPYLKVVLSLPEDEAGRQRVLQAFHLQANLFGARVQACALQDKPD